MTVSGSGPWMRNPGTASATGLISARFNVIAGASQAWGANESDYVLWDALEALPNRNTWDDLGFPTDYETTGGFFFGTGYAPVGEYFIDAFVRLDPNSSAAADPGFGTFLIGIEAGDTISEEQTTLASQEIGPKLHVSGVHRFYDGNFFQIQIKTFNCEGFPFAISAASVAIVKLRDIDPL